MTPCDSYYSLFMLKPHIGPQPCDCEQSQRYLGRTARSVLIGFETRLFALSQLWTRVKSRYSWRTTNKPVETPCRYDHNAIYASSLTPEIIFGAGARKTVANLTPLHFGARKVLLVSDPASCRRLLADVEKEPADQAIDYVLLTSGVGQPARQEKFSAGGGVIALLD